MSSICNELDLRLKNEQVQGICKWLDDEESWQEKKNLREYASQLPKEKLTTKQKLIFYLLGEATLDSMLALESDFHLLDEQAIEELITYHRLEKPAQRYQEIKDAIASPEGYNTGIPYAIICELHKREKVPFDRQIFVACLIRFRAWPPSSYSKTLPQNLKERFGTIFPQDNFSIDILMAVFEMELGVDGAYYIEPDFNIGSIIVELVANGKLPRAVVQQKLFDAFNNPTLKQTTHGFAKNIYRDLAFSTEENIACQEQLIQLMYCDRNLIKNIALQQLKKISTHKTFDWSLFIQSLDGIVYTEKLIGGLKTALAILYKGLKKDNTLVEPCCVNLAPIFLQEDNTIQTAAGKCFELLESPNEAVTEALLPFIDTMHSDVKVALSKLLSDEVPNTDHATYIQEPYTPAPCNDGTKINYIDNENDFIFLLSKTLKSSDAIDYELFLEALPRYAYLKDTQAKILKSALKQAEKTIANFTAVHHVMAAKLIFFWLSPNAKTMEEERKEWKEKTNEAYHYTANWYVLFSQFRRIIYLANQLNEKEHLPLLSTPTHNDFQIDPSLFWERLSKYEAANKTPDQGDFCLAICRLNRWSTFDKKKLNTTTEHHRVLSYLFGESTFDSSHIKDLNQTWLTAYTIKNPDKGIDALIANIKQEKWWQTSTPWDWEMGQENSSDGKHTWTTIKTSYKSDRYSISDFSKISHFEHHLTGMYHTIITDMEHWFRRDGFQQEPLFLNLIHTVFNFYSNIEAREYKSLLAVIKHQASHPAPLGKAGYLALGLSLINYKAPIRTAAFDWLSLLIEQKLLDIDLFTESMAKLAINEEHAIPVARTVEQFGRLLQAQGVYIDILYKTIELCLTQINPTNIPKGFGKMLHLYYEVLQLINQPIPSDIGLVLEQLKNTSSVKKEIKKLLSL